MVAEEEIESAIPFGCVMSAVSVPWLVSAIKVVQHEGLAPPIIPPQTECHSY